MRLHQNRDLTLTLIEPLFPGVEQQLALVSDVLTFIRDLLATRSHQVALVCVPVPQVGGALASISTRVALSPALAISR
jgi:hypothetical protein